MSRNYEVLVEVFPCTAEQLPAVCAVLRCWGMLVEGDVATFDDNYPDDGWCIWGSISLSTEPEQDKHDQRLKLLPERYLPAEAKPRGTAITTANG